MPHGNVTWCLTFTATIVALAGTTRSSGIALPLRSSAAALTTSTDSQSSPAAGAISGRVIDGATGAPIAGAVVSLVAPGATVNATGQPPASRQATDRSGRFLFTQVPRQRAYNVLATKPGYFDGASGVEMTGGTPRRLVVADDGWLNDATVTLWKPAAISGTVLDEAGEPVVGAYVAAIAHILVAGVPTFANGPATRTDDRGAYRIAPLTAGTYSVVVPSIQVAVPVRAPLDPDNFTSAQVGLPVDGANVLLLLERGSLVPPPPRADGRRQSYPVTFYPAARSVRSASAIDLSPGDDRIGIDVQLRPAPVSRISGQLEGPPLAIDNRRLRLMPTGSESMGIGHEAAVALSVADGSFTFVDVPDGAYTILADSGATGYDYHAPGVFLTPSLHSVAGLSGIFGMRSTLGGSAAATASFPSRIASGAPASLRVSSFALGQQETFIGRLTVDVAGADLTGLVVRLQEGVSISGRFAMDRPQDRATLAELTPYLDVAAQPASADPALREVRGGVVPSDPTLNFSLAGLWPGSYMLRFMGSAAMVKSVTWNGKESTGLPFTVSDHDLSGLVVTLTTQVAQVEGTVRDAQGRPAGQAAIMYFPVEPDRWQRYGPQPDRLGSVSTTSTGFYGIFRLPAGDYYAVAVQEGLAGAWKDPTFLEAAARVATRITVSWGETRVQDLTLTTIPR